MLSAEETKPRPPRATKAYDTLSVGSLGLEMGLAVLLGWWGGQWLDTRFETGPYLMLLGMGFGIAAAFNGLFRAARQAKRSATESDGEERNRDGSR
jgi:F0F1-type ATP synthase assembly protein I